MSTCSMISESFGALAYNFSAICIMPFFGIKMESIEYEHLS